MRYFIEVSYHGGRYHGWQIQQNANTVQHELNQALEKFLRCSIETIGSSRTDAGVHALQQFCHLDLPEPLDEALAVHKLNTILPEDISAKHIFQVSEDVHARFSAISRSYEYRITKNKDPFGQYTSYYFRQDLVVENIKQACEHLVGQKDFKCFSKSRTSVDNYLCTITNAQWIDHNGSYCFYVSANRFLRGMVRTIVGTLLEVGKGNYSIQDFKEIINSRDRTKAGRSVPAHGLYLTRVEYPKTISRPL